MSRVAPASTGIHRRSFMYGILFEREAILAAVRRSITFPRRRRKLIRSGRRGADVPSPPHRRHVTTPASPASYCDTTQRSRIGGHMAKLNVNGKLVTVNASPDTPL